MRLCGIATGLLFSVGSTVLLALIAFGRWSFSEEGDCFAVQFPDRNQYPADPTKDDPANFAGLQVVNVSSRLKSMAVIGFIIELSISVMIVLGIATSVMNAFKGLATMTQDALGYLSLGWFIWLMFARYDHYGKVCTGDYLDGEESTFVNLIKAGRVL